MLARPLQAGRHLQNLIFRSSGGGLDGLHLRFAFGECSGFIYNYRIDLFQNLQRLGIFDEDPGPRSAARAYHHRHGSGQPQRAGAGNDQHRNRIHDGEREARLRPPDRPGGKRQHRRQHYERHEECGDFVGISLDGRAAPLGLADQIHNLRQQRF